MPAPKVSLPNVSYHNEVVVTDLSWWNDPVRNKSVILFHVMDAATRFSTARFVKDKNPETILNAFCSMWISLFGPPQRTWIDNGGEFANEEFITLLERFGVHGKNSAGQAAFSNGIIERHNLSLKSIMTKVKYDGRNWSYSIGSYRCSIGKSVYTKFYCLNTFYCQKCFLKSE